MYHDWHNFTLQSCKQHPLLMELIVINHISALNPTAKPPNIENKTWAQWGFYCRYWFVCLFFNFCRNTCSCTEITTSNLCIKKAEKERMTFIFYVFKDLAKVCLPFDSDKWLYHSSVPIHIWVLLRKQNNTFKAVVTFCCSSSAARVKTARILDDEEQKISLFKMPNFSEFNHVFSLLLNFILMYLKHKGFKYLNKQKVINIY